MIDEALEDLRADPREKRDIVLQRLLRFYRWLKTDCPRMSKGRGSNVVVGKGLSDKLAHNRVAAIRSFYATFGITVRMRGRTSLPKARVENERMRVNAEQVNILVEHARTLRDKAIIWTGFQSGMDAHTLCSVNYGTVAEGLKNGDCPLKMDLFRKKTGVDYYSFIGESAISAIRVYIRDMESRGVVFSSKSPLFQKHKGGGRLTPNLIQNMMKIVAVKSGFVDKDNNGKAFNPLGPHALRESFGSLMINNGVPDSIVDFWLGHSVGEKDKAYKSVQLKSLTRMYRERSNLFNVSVSEIDVEKIEREIKSQFKEESSKLQSLVTDLASENVETKKQLVRQSKKLDSMERDVVRLKRDSNALIILAEAMRDPKKEKELRKLLGL
ncbi:MAG: tyrosine-type recombinase/integrase [Candidatus Bathyarchaeota archaeon]|nr:tyrosine-type recombinase/integrase [Candidatus Bathyarchaeum sp.]